MIAALAAAVPVALQLRTATKLHLEELKSTPEVEKALDQQIREEYGPTHRASAAQEAQIQGIMTELKANIPQAAPQAKYVAEKVKIYVVDDDTPYIDSFSSKPDGKNAILGIVISRGALRNPIDPSQSLNRDELKAVLGHELAHHLMILDADMHTNPKVRYLDEDKRFAPSSKQFFEEYDRLADKLKKNPLTPEEKKDMEGIQPPLTPKEKQQYIEDAVQNKLSTFAGEVRADKLGLWLSGDAVAAGSAERKLNGLGSAIDEDLRKSGQEGVLARPAETVADPHPSYAAREQERVFTQVDMKTAERAKNAHHHTTPQKPADTPKSATPQKQGAVHQP